MDKDSCRSLIRLYGSKLLLWNSTSPWYRNKHMREEAWKEISAEMGMPMPLLKKKMTSLMSCYRRERWRLDRKIKIGSGRGVCKSKWFAFNEFSFMRNKTSDETSCEVKKTIKQEIDAQSNEELITCENDEDPLNLNKAPKRRKLRTFNIIAGSNTDPYFTFGQNLANELRKYDSRTLSYVKRAINNVIFEADLGKYTPKSRGSSREE
ncbi:uncharacterized protein LOC115454569 [Manduca sexta]|uniref:uncharacterized protein LOC115454569 n=1 Tax=Manduca sexta TaxID=7130 RepID=UPI001183A9E1|nr:uncharacterized protein LOC115454569 [Manduca sexta]